MESKPKELKLGDPCPSCTSVLRAVPVPTDAAYAAAHEKENPIFLPAGVDTASPAFRAEHGNLHVCDRCGYTARFTDTDA
jgi:hypothetical protein